MIGVISVIQHVVQIQAMPQDDDDDVDNFL